MSSVKALRFARNAIARLTTGQGVNASGLVGGAKRTQRLFTMVRGFDERRWTKLMSSPPTLTLGTTSTITSGVYKPASNPLFQYLSTLPLPWSGNADYRIAGHVTNSTVDTTQKQGNAFMRVRFITDAPKFEVVLNGNGLGQIVLRVNGEFTNDFGIVPNPSGGTTRIIVDFGTDTKTLYVQAIPQAAASGNPGIAAAGSGYTVGDIVTLVGGTSTTATQARVSSVDGGGAVQTLAVTTPGVYSVVPTPALTTNMTTTGGTGTGLTVRPRWAQRYAKRADRDIEVWGSGMLFGGITVGPQDTITAPPALNATGRLIVMGDSITTSSFQDAAGFLGFRYLAEGLDYQDYYQSGLPGTGWVTTANNIPLPNQRLASDIYPLINGRTVVVDALGVNDPEANATQVQAAALAKINALQAYDPDVLQVVLSCYTTATQDKALVRGALGAAVAAATDQKRVRFVDLYNLGFNLNPGQGTATNPVATGNSSFILMDDGTHPGTYGAQQWARFAGPYVSAAIESMVLA